MFQKDLVICVEPLKANIHAVVAAGKLSREAGLENNSHNLLYPMYRHLGMKGVHPQSHHATF